MWNWELELVLVCLVRILQFEIQFFAYCWRGVRVKTAVFDFSLIRTKATYRLIPSYLELICEEINKWAWCKRFRFSTTFCIPLSGVSAVYDGVCAYRKRLALECAPFYSSKPMSKLNLRGMVVTTTFYCTHQLAIL